MFNSLISRIILLNVLLLIIGVGTFAMYHLQREQGHLIDVNRQNAELLLNTIERSIFHSMCTGNQANVQAILEKVGSSRELLAVQIFGPQGTILRSARPEELGTAINQRNFDLFQSGNLEGYFETEDGERAITKLLPIMSDGRCVECHGEKGGVIGVLNLDFSLLNMYDQLRTTSETFIVSTLVNLIALTAGIALIMTRLLRRPLRQISKGMAKVEAGDLSVRMPERANDEVGQLMSGFNSMVRNLENAQTELQQYHYQQMERADRLASIGEMAAGLAHEIKNPLAGIGGAIDVLADDYEKDDPRREVMSQIQKQISRLNRTVTDLLYFGKPGEPEFNYVDMNNLLKQTQLFISQHPEAKNINWIEELTRDLPLVWADQKQLQQVLLNLMINGLQAMSGGGVMTVQTEHVELEGRDWVKVDISDTGPGIPQDQLNKIFTPFFTSKTEGTGLGLPICRQLMVRNGGKLSVTSEQGKGACFTLLLPVAENQEAVELKQD
ncbi:hypothetical protein SAMN02745165_01623 [Malonomonas rubra DSM 5091]|uniref:histidine kinase n=1 Tax=Malonomonas rubra DSM 5091 TaxID=1122189 RepID=A0A1M6GPG3_MALRU|nr:HAMP domain-containing sensor histidine kinase [Malonomonas rubra]SHJ11875.1 hypothetical protein SAMN02745165_01623 [Malonomonas rubra DSM 5091]